MGISSGGSSGVRSASRPALIRKLISLHCAADYGPRLRRISMSRNRSDESDDTGSLVRGVRDKHTAVRDEFQHELGFDARCKAYVSHER